MLFTRPSSRSLVVLHAMRHRSREVWMPFAGPSTMSFVMLLVALGTLCTFWFVGIGFTIAVLLRANWSARPLLYSTWVSAGPMLVGQASVLCVMITELAAWLFLRTMGVAKMLTANLLSEDWRHLWDNGVRFQRHTMRTKRQRK